MSMATAAMWPRYETVVRPAQGLLDPLQRRGAAMWPRYETVVRLSLSWTRSRPSSSCNVATVRDRGATSTNPAQSQNLQLQCGHGTRPWCDSVSARCGHTVWVAAMWPRYETVVRPADLWLCANEDQAAMWPRYETVVRPGQVGGPDARPQAAMWPRYETVVRLGIHPAQEDGRLAAMWPRYETVVRLPVVVAGITGSGKLQCGHGTRPWCDLVCDQTMPPHSSCNVATVRDRGATSAENSPKSSCQLQCGHGTRPWCDGTRRIREPPSAALSGAASDPLGGTGRVREVARTSSSRGVELGVRAMVGWIHFSRCGGGANGSARAQQRLGKGEAPVAGLDPAGLKDLGHPQAAQSLVAFWGGSHIGVAEQALDHPKCDRRGPDRPAHDPLRSLLSEPDRRRRTALGHDGK